jgi:hypothetical protein
MGLMSHILISTSLLKIFCKLVVVGKDYSESCMLNYYKSWDVQYATLIFGVE